MKSDPISPNVVAIRLEGQKYLTDLERRGFILPSLENVRLSSKRATQSRLNSDELQGFAEDEQEPLNTK